MDIFSIKCVASSKIPVSVLVAGTMAQPSAVKSPQGEFTYGHQCGIVVNSFMTGGNWSCKTIDV